MESTDARSKATVEDTVDAIVNGEPSKTFNTLNGLFTNEFSELIEIVGKVRSNMIMGNINEIDISRALEALHRLQDLRFVNAILIKSICELQKKVSDANTQERSEE